MKIRSVLDTIGDSKSTSSAVINELHPGTDGVSGAQGERSKDYMKRDVRKAEEEDSWRGKVDRGRLLIGGRLPIGGFENTGK